MSYCRKCQPEVGSEREDVRRFVCECHEVKSEETKPDYTRPCCSKCRYNRREFNRGQNRRFKCRCHELN